MKQLSACPRPEEYHRLLAGAPLSSDSELLLEHVEQCLQCAARLDEMGSVDPMLEAARACRTACQTPLPEATVHLIEQLQQRLPQASLADSAAAGPTAHVEAGAAAPDCWFLAPAQSGDELGRLGNFRVLRLLGRGGMGMVFEAEDTLLRRRVALKVIKGDLAGSGPSRERFLREARAAAALRHDHIVVIHSVSEDRGVPFLTMEYLEGESLAAHLQRVGPLPVEEAVRLARQIAAGVAAAHAQGLIHRDIKPANIWLDSQTGRVKLLDFGLARVAIETEQLTQQGAILGTPVFLAPEQVDAELGPVDARVDVYSLGATLYQMVTGRVPFEGNSAQVLRQKIALDPPPPSRHRSELDRALEAIIQKAMARRPEQRYASAQELNAALDAWLQTSEPAPVAPRRDRWRTGLVALGAGLVVLLAGIIIIRDRDGKEVARIKVTDGAQVELIRDSGPSPFDALKRDDIAPEELALAGASNPASVPELVAILGDSRWQHWGGIQALAWTHDGRQVLSCGHFADGASLWNLATGYAERRLRPTGSLPTSVTVGATGRYILTSSQELGALLWHADTGQPAQEFESSGVRRVAISADERRVATARIDRKIHIWETTSGRHVQAFVHQQDIAGLAFSADGKRLVSCAGNDGIEDKLHELVVRDVATGKECLRLADAAGFAMCVAWSRDGKQIAAGSRRGAIRLWDAETGKVAASFDQGSPVSCIAFSADGRLLATGGSDTGSDTSRAVQIWDLAAGKRQRTLPRHNATVSAVAFSPDSKLLATGDQNGPVRLWDVGTGQLAHEPKGHAGPVLDARALGQGRVAAAGADGRVLLWEMRDGQPQRARALACHDGVVWGLSIDRGRDLLLSTGNDGARLWDSRGDKTWLLPWRFRAGPAALAPDGHRYAAGGGRDLRVYDSRSGVEVGKIPVEADVVCVALGADHIAVCCDDRTVSVYDQAGAKVADLDKLEHRPECICFAADGRLLAVGDGSGRVYLWKPKPGEPAHVIVASNMAVRGVALSPDAGTLAAVDADGVLRLWSMDGYRATRTWRLGPARAPMNNVSFALDGRHLFTANGDGTVYVLRLEGAPP